MAPEYEELAKELKNFNSLLIAKIDFDTNEALDITVENYPAVMLFKRGQKKNPIIFEGLLDKNHIEKFL